MPVFERVCILRGFMSSDILYIVIPCYNEEEVIYKTASALKVKMMKLMEAKIISDQSRVMFVNDGSRDKTWQIISELHAEDKLFSGVDLTRNRGHQNALLAGLMAAKEHADVVISMDADLQDDIDAMDSMMEKYHEGCDIVYGVRSSREKDTFFKRVTAEGFYKFMAFLGVDIVFNHADYRLMSKHALEGLEKFREVNLFLRGIIPMIGYNTALVEYERGARLGGKSKYPLKKMLIFALEGITSFSIRPLHMIFCLGMGICLFSVTMLFYIIIQWLRGVTVTGWTSLICSIWVIGGLVLLSIGVLGEYIGKIYLESKARPRFIIREILNRHDDAH